MARHSNPDDEKRLPSRERTDDLVRQLNDASAQARMLKARINEAKKQEQASVFRSPKRRRR